MYILGLSTMDDASATLVKDGELLTAAEEERWSRKKHHVGFPYHAVQYCLDREGIELADIDHVGLYWQWYDLGGRIKEVLRPLFKNPAHFIAKSKRGGGLLSKWYGMARTASILKENFPSHGREPHFQMHHLNHHLCHAASCFFVSPFEEAAILTLDGAGESTTTQMSIGRGNHIEVLQRTFLPHSLGQFYSAITGYLGFKMRSGEGKIMGLASYGQPEYKDFFSKVIRLLPDGRIEIDTDIVDYHYALQGGFSQELTKAFGPPRKPESEILPFHKNFAASLQVAFEDAALHIARALYKKTKMKKLCMAGGCVLNSVMNSRILRETDFEEVYLQAASGDSGPCLGAAYVIYHQFLKKARCFHMYHAFWGAGFSDEAVEEALKGRGIIYHRWENVAAGAADLLSKGKFVGWFQGRAEFGPRALGNRSILADPRGKDVKDNLNARVKHREAFRPFAPSVLVEKCGEYFESDVPSPFMLLVHGVRKEKQDVVPAITHVDGTGRVQTVSREENPLYYELISEFEKRTGVPMVLDTSFNLRGEPIVNTPDHAIDVLLKTDLDDLVIGNFHANRQDNKKRWITDWELELD